jgi:hypothetical protein
MHRRWRDRPGVAAPGMFPVARADNDGK